MVSFTVAKKKVAQVMKRYEGGEFVEVDQEASDYRRVATVGLDNKHSKDHKVGPASDPLVLVTGESGVTHDQLRNELNKLGIWKDSFIPVEIIHGNEWRSGFKSLPEDSGLIGRMHGTVQKQVDDHELLGGKEEFTVYR